MNKQFTDEQLRAYAAQFREGDAIYITNVGWGKLVFNCDGYLMMNKDGMGNSYPVRNSVGVAYVSGFTNGEVSNPFRVTTIDKYELQGGEKIVCLGKDIDLTFGKSYTVQKPTNDRASFIVDDVGDKVMTNSRYFKAVGTWGIIPRYEQVKNLEKTTITEKVNEVVANKMNERPASSHYHIDNNGNDVWQFADDNLSDERVKGFHQINAIKYVSRYEKKHDTAEKRIEDLKKAKVSIDKLIELEELE